MEPQRNPVSESRPELSKLLRDEAIAARLKELAEAACHRTHAQPGNNDSSSRRS
jgi:hypothetical protein